MQEDDGLNDYGFQVKRKRQRQRRMPDLNGLDYGFHIIMVDSDANIRIVSPTESVLKNFDERLPGFLSDLIRGNRRD